MNDSKTANAISPYDQATLEYLTAAGVSAQLVERVRRLALAAERKRGSEWGGGR